MAIVKHILKVVLASPGDVKEERQAIQDVVQRVNVRLRKDHPVVLELWQWETDASPGFHPQGPQGQIDESLRIEDADVLVGVFARRFGSPVNDAKSGTEHEIRRATAVRREKGSPQVMLYFKKEDFRPALASEREQYEALRRYKEELFSVEDLAERPLVWDYAEIPRLMEVADNHLWEYAVGFARKHPIEPSYAGLRFEMTVEPTTIREEGRTELLGNVFINCWYQGGTPEEHPAFALRVYLNAMITSPEVVLFEVGRPSSTNFLASKPEGNTVRFDWVTLDDLRPDEIRRFQIANLRCGGHHGPISLRVFATGGPVRHGRQTPAAVTAKGLQFSVLAPDGGRIANEELEGALLLIQIAQLRFTEGFPYAFKTRLGSRLIPRAGTEIVNTGESCLFGSVVGRNGSVQYSGIADHGTKLCAAFRNIPAGVRLFVSASAFLLWSNAQFTVTESDSTLAPGTSVLSLRNKVYELQADNGRARVCWELTESSLARHDPGYVDFGVFLSNAENYDSVNRPISVNGSFAPIPTYGAFHSAQSDGPIPRFFDISFARNLPRIRVGD